MISDGDKGKKNQMEEFIQTDPSVLNHNDFFKLLQSSALEYRLNDPFCSLVSFLIFVFLKNSILIILLKIEKLKIILGLV